MTMLYLTVALLAMVMINVPIAVALGVVATSAMVLSAGLYALPNMATTLFSGATSFPLLAIPLFIFAGAIMNASGISARLIAFASALVGFLRGGLAMVPVATSLFFARRSRSWRRLGRS